MGVVSGDNKQSQEGLNGSVSVDETAVVDAELTAILRSEPIQIEVSTAGNNPDGYGKQRYDYGKRVVSGMETDETLLFEAYESDPSIPVTDENILELGKKANPSWGILINPDEFLSEYNNSKRSISDFNNFKMYRLGHWQKSSNPFIPQDAWRDCAVKFNARTLIRRDAFGGLDLSKVSDATAFALALPADDGFVDLIIRLWMPEAYAKRYDLMFPFLKWAEEGYLKLTPGDTMDYNIVRRDIFKLCSHFYVHEIGYDPMYGEDVTQQLSEGWYSNDGKTCFNSGIGCERVEFSQTHEGLSEATDNFLGLVVDRKLRHGNNPVLNWMSEHCDVKENSDGKKKPIKPDNNHASVKKIDGILASIMACARAIKMRETCAYDSGKVLFV